MPLDKGKLQKLYSTLQHGGYSQSYDEFEKGFTGNDNYPNRKKVYDLLTEHGAQIGNSYEDFMKKMQTQAASSPAPSSSQQRTPAPAPAPKPQPKPTPKPKPRPQPKPKGGGMTAAERSQFIRNAQGIVHQSAAGLQRVKNQMDYANSNRGLKVRPVHLSQNSKVVRRHANGTVAKPRPVFDVAPEQQPGDTYLTESGNEFTSRAEADTEQNAVDQYRYDQSETGQLNNAYAEADRLDKLLEQRGKELDAENQDKWWRDLPRGGGGAVSTMNANDNNGRMTDTEYLNLLAARKKVDEQIRDLKAARDEKTGTFLGGLWRGFRDYAFDPSNWDNGYRDLLTTSAMLRAKTGAAQTPREKASERMMMEDTYKAGEAAQKAEKVLGNGYRFMHIGAQSLPFALQFMAGNAMGMTGGIARAGEGMGVKLARKIAIKQGANNMMRNIGRSVLKNTGVMLGDLGAATALTTTIQAGQTGADIGQRYAGDVAYDPKTDDYKLEGGKSLGRSIYEGEANSIIENYTEMLGEHMHLGKFASSALTKVGLGRVSNWFTKVGKTDFMQGVNKYMKMAGFNGYPQEVMEEEVGIPLHAIFDGGNKMSDLLDGRQQLDIVGGMLFSMAGMGGASMVMQGGHKAAMAVQYHQDQHKLDNADKAASFRLTADKWAPIKEEIDGTTNEDFGKVMKGVLSNDELSDQEKQAVWDYAQRLVIMRGHNMGQEAATRNGMTDKETNTANESYTQGYNTTDATAMNDAKNRLAAAQQKFDEYMEKTGREHLEGEPSMQDIQHRHRDAQSILSDKWADGTPVYNENDEEYKLAQAVVNAQQEYEGMMQRVRDDIDDEVQQTGAIYDSRTNDQGVIQSATLKAQNPDGTDKKVYITSGNVVMTDDGKSVDNQKSDMSIVVVDEDGKVQMISPDELFSLDTPIDGAQAKQQAIDAIQQSKAQEAADKINGKVNLTAGNTYTLTDNTGQQIEATIVADGQTGAVQNPDGTVNVSMNGKVVAMDVNTLQQMVDNTNMQKAEQGLEPRLVSRGTERGAEDSEGQEQPTEQEGDQGILDQGGTVVPDDEDSGAVPSYPGSVVAPDVQEPHQWQVDDTFTIDNDGVPVRGQVTGVGEDGVEIYTESPVNGKKMQVVSPAELQSMTTEINGEAVEAPEDEAAAEQQPTEPSPTEQNAGNVTDGVNGSNGVNGEQAQEQATQAQEQAQPQQTEGQPQRAIDRIPSQDVDDGKGNVRTVHNWEQSEPGDTYDALTEIYHGNDDRVKKGIDNRVGKIDKAIKGVQKQMDAIDNSDDFDEVAAQSEQYDQLQQQKDELEKQKKYWQGVQMVPRNRKMDADRRSAEEQEAAKAAQEKAEAEAAEKARQEREQVNGVPDVVNDIPADARKRGFRNVNGMVVNRQGETQGVSGRESNVKFSSTDTAKGHIKVIDADQLQPSHVSGQRNPSFFIDEAQPKDRTDTVSSMAAAKIASNLNPEEITGDGSAYQFSAPTVNSRGEVIQGNNRSDALKLMYSTPAFKPAQDAYKQYIADHAEEFGFTPEDVQKIQQMEHPVMVNELDVPDDEAIRLGQMRASDNESGGIERIDPMTTSQKLGGKVSNFANVLLSSPDEDASLSDVLMQNGAKTVKWLRTQGAISDTAAQSAFDKKGNLTPEARMDLQNILKQSLFQGGVSDLSTMFDKMPAKAQKAILSTFMRDFDSAESERILPEIQKAIETWYGCAMSNEAFAKASNYKAAKNAMHDWTLQTNLLDDNMPSDKFSNFAMELACRLQGCSMRETQQSLNDFFDLVQGKSQGDLFGGTTMGEQADRQEAIRRIFNIEYQPINNNNNGKTGSNAMADNSSQSGEGRQGSPTDGKGRERAESGSGSANGAGGTESHDEEGIDKGAAVQQRPTQPDYYKPGEKVLYCGNEYTIGKRNDDGTYELMSAPYVQAYSSAKEDVLVPVGHRSSPIGNTSSSEKKETERQSVNTEPSEKQKEAGNYKKGHIKVDGYDITIENPKGSVREKKDENGKVLWRTPMHYDYGYILGTKGTDGDHIDVYLSDNPTSGNVYVVDQIDQQTGKFDEHKVMYGFPSKEAAVEAYKSQYEKGWKVGMVTEVSREDFKKWVESSKRKTKPFSEYKSVQQSQEQAPTYKERTTLKNNLAGGDAHISIIGNPQSGYDVNYYGSLKEADAHAPMAIGNETMSAEQLSTHLRNGDFTPVSSNEQQEKPAPKKRKTNKIDKMSDDEFKEFYEQNEGNDQIKASMLTWRPYTEYTAEQFKDAISRVPDKELNNLFGMLKASKRKNDVTPYLNDIKNEFVARSRKASQETQHPATSDKDKKNILGVSENEKDAAMKKLAALLRGKGENVTAGLDLKTLLEQGGAVARYYVGNGIVKFADFAKKLYGDMRDLGEDVAEAIKPYIKRIYLDVQGDMSISDDIINQMDDARTVRSFDVAQLGQEEKPTLIEKAEQVSNELQVETNANANDEKDKADMGANMRTDSYTIAPTTYTTKRGREQDMFVVQFKNELTDEQYKKARDFAKENKGWRDRNTGDWFMRSEEDAQKLADMIAGHSQENEAAQADGHLIIGGVPKAGETKQETKQEPKETFDPVVRKDLEHFIGESNDKRVAADWSNADNDNEYVPLTIDGKSSYVGVTEQEVNTEEPSFPSDRSVAIYDIEEGGELPDAAKMDQFHGYVDAYNKEKNLNENSDDYATLDDEYPYVSFKNVDAAVKFNDWLQGNRQQEGTQEAQPGEKQNTESEKTPATKNKETKNSVSSQQKAEPTLFDDFFKNNTQSQEDNGLQRNDELRPEGLQAGSDNKGEHTQGQSKAATQGREGADGQGKAAGLQRVRTGNNEPVRPGNHVETTATESQPKQPLNVHNNHAERGRDYAPKGVDDRINANIAAIELAQKIIEEGRQATPAEMKILRKYSGWGGLGKAFNEKQHSWSPDGTAEKLKALLGPEGYQEAVMSRNSAYFTPAGVIDNLWDIAKALGFKGGNVLEGSAGIGNIIGLMPRDMSDRSHIHAVEIDRTTGMILSLLYPDAKTDIQGFEQTKIRNGSVDLAITNVPFVTGLHVNDTTGDSDLSRKFGDIHDFCIAKNVRKLKPGGIGIFITSSGTMDRSQKLRDWIVNEGDADFIGAFRMNNETFGGTAATSDIIVIRRRVNGMKSPMSIDVSHIGVERTAKLDILNRRGEVEKQEQGVDYNQYFIDHPENMGGKMYYAGEKGDTYRPTSKGLYPMSNISQQKRMAEWVNRLGRQFAEAAKEEPTQQQSAPEEHGSQVYEALGPDVHEGSMLVDKHGNLCIASYGEAVPLAVNKNKVKGHTKVECFNDYSNIKKAVQAVLDYETHNDDDKGLKPLIDNLNKVYDDFVNKYGHLNKNTSLSFLKNDMDFASIAALENFNETGDRTGKRIITYDKSDIFKKRVVEKETEPQPKNVRDGVITSIYQYGKIDLDYIANQLGRTTDDVKKEIIDSGLGFEDPLSGDTVVSYEYLSGNVREKLQQAEQANEDGKYDKNIEALKKVIPMNIPSHLIEFTLGSSWLDPELYEEYVKDRTGIDVKTRNIDGTWAVDAPDYGYITEKNKSFGVHSSMFNKDIYGHELIAAALKNKSIAVTRTTKTNGHTETQTDKEATMMCAQRIEEIRDDFKDWARAKMQADAKMAKKYEDRYNNQFNNYVPREIPDSFLPEYFSGANHAIHLRAHQAKAAIRATMQNVLFAHEVGSGKTFTLITTAMEMRRLGTAKKPMVVVQNATVGQFVASAKMLYPNAKILTIADNEHNEAGRKAFYAKIKYNDWDMIVIPQSVVEKIPDSDERQLKFIQDRVEEKKAVLEQMKEAEVDDPTLTRRAESEIAALEAQMGELTSQMSKKKKDGKREAVAMQNATVRAQRMLDRKVDEVADFDDMGIDALLVDEAHEYKHLGFATAMQRGVKGVDPSYSKKSQGIYLKCQSVMERSGGKNVVFATGTPISNTAAEIWTFMKYLMPEDAMKSYGIYYFDDFVRNFGTLSQMPEFNTSGKFVEVNRFRGYENLPELVRIWSGVADTVLSREVGDLKAKIPEMKTGKAIDIYLPQSRALRSIMKYVRQRLEEYSQMSGKEKRENSSIPLVMYGIAKQAAVDPRLVMDNAEDDPRSKTNATVKEVLTSLDESKGYNGTVAVFADNYQNRRSGFNIFDDIKKKLVKAGVPEEKIVIIRPSMNVKKKTEIFDKLNSGEVRVVLGTTFTLGTGANFQERLYEVIHMDAPNRPMDYTQRNGRILRQGNLHKEWGIPVKIVRFGVEDSLDVTAYQRLKTKGAIADSIMHGKSLMNNSMEDRTIEEEQDEFGDTVAQLSGSEYAMLKQAAEREVRKYENKYKQWEADQVYISNAKKSYNEDIDRAKKSIDYNNSVLEKLKTHQGDGSITIGKQTFKSADEMEDFFKDYNKKIKADEEELRNNPSIPSKTRKLTATVNGIEFNIDTEVWPDTQSDGMSLFQTVHHTMTVQCPELEPGREYAVDHGLLRNAISLITNDIVSGKLYESNKKDEESYLQRLESELAEVTKRDGKPFQYGEQLEKAKAKLADYTEKMKKELEEKEAKYAEMDKEVSEANLDNDQPTTPEEAEEGDVLYREVDDEEAAILDSEPTVKVYRAMQEHDGKLYPPMSGRVREQYTTKKGTVRNRWVWRQPTELGKWEQSEEHPEMANEDGTFTLDKGNGSTVPAAYNPYIHTSRTPINDQFSSAWSRPELVTVEVEVPESELTSHYHAEKAKDATGEVDWKSGPVGREMAAIGRPRKVILSRWDKPVRIVPVDEVAEEYAKRLAGTGISVPFNTVPPALRDALVTKGVEISEPESGMAGDASRPSYEEWLRGDRREREGNGAYTDDELSYMNDPVAKMLGRSQRIKTQRARFAEGERANMVNAVEDLAEKLHLDNVEIRRTSGTGTSRMSRAKGYYSRKTGKIVINIDNHRDVEDVMQTLLHEGVAHYGLRQLFGEHFDTFLDNVYAAADNDVRRRITDLAIRKYGGDFRVATEEYLASLAERTDFEHIPETFWQKIKDFFLDMLHAIGFEGFARTGVTLSDNELRYILWRSYENLKEPGRYRSILGEAEDVAKQAELKVGNYGETGAAAQQRPTEPSTTEQQEEREQNPSTAAMYGSARNSDYAAANDGVREPEAWGKRDMLSKAEQVSHGIDPDLLFRDTIEDDDNTARETYNRMADEAKSRIREAWQDSMINVRNLQQAVLEQRGEKLEDYEDAYNAENRSHGKSRAESEYFTDNLYKPLLKAVNALAKATNVSVGDVTEYMMAKHGLERNIVFARRDADAAYKKAYDEAKGKYDALMNASRTESDPKKADALEKAANKVKFPDYDDIFNYLRMRDYAGLTALTGQSDVQDAEAEAQRIVNDMESRAAAMYGGAHNQQYGLIAELWKATNAATKWTLKKGYESGIISKDNYNYVSGMFNYYVPLRGWQEDTAGDLFDYVGSGDKGTAFSPTLHKAKGRRSEADNPIAYIGNMAVSAIVQGNKNKVKQTFLGFVENHPTNLVTVSEMWYRNFGTDTDPDWREDVPSIPEDATADEVADIVQQHEDLMEQLEDLGKATKQRGRLHLGVPVKRGQALEHHVEVMVNGKKYVLYINGNPRAAQALNGTRKRRASERSFESSKIARMGRLLAERYTSLSPSFTVSNALRDLTMAAITTLIKESPAYALRFRLNVAKLGGPARMFTLMRWYKKAAAQQQPTGQMSETEKYFYEFMTEGAETGFTSLKEIDEYKKDMDKMYRNMNQKLLNPKRLFRGLSKGLEYANRCIEDMTRFAIYMASRQSGRNVKRSVNDAKNVTLNFNRKGSGEMGNATYRNLQIFVNPAIQSLQNVGKMAKDHPVRFTLLTGSIALIGAAQVFATQLLWSMFGGGDGDDDNWNAVDEYWKLPTWQRRNNLVMWIPGTKKFAMIPLAQEFRVFHGFGETMTTVMEGKSSENPALEVLTQASDLLPLDFAGNNGNPLVNLAPTITQPLLQVGFNTDFTGRPLFKDSDYNKYEPTFQKAYVGTPSWLIKSSEFINDITGGDDHKQGWWERTKVGKELNNPAVVDHILKGYYGGLYSFFAQLGGTVFTLGTGNMPDAQEVPIVNRVITAPRETEQGGKQKLPDWYYDLSEENARKQNEFSGYKKDYMKGDADGQKKFNELIKGKDFQKWQEVNAYIGAVQQIRTAMNYTKDPNEKAELEKSLAEVLGELKKMKDE